MKKILVAFDGSEHALKAVKEAMNLRVGFPDATVTILSVLEVAKAKIKYLISRQALKNVKRRESITSNNN